MSKRPFITATLIARNEAHQITRCLASFWDSVDEVILCDTGSRDDTVKFAHAFAEHRGQPRKLRVKSFEWTDDFSAARNYADSFAKGEWLLWADADDEVVGADALRQMGQDAPADVVAYFVLYNYAQDEHDNSISELWRERLVRNDGTKWEGRLHEHKVFLHGAAIQVPPETARWMHHRDPQSAASSVRNRRVLEAWDREEPENPRIIQSLGLEYLGANEWELAVDTFTRYLTFDGEQKDRRAQASRYLSTALMQIGRVQDAQTVAFASLAEHWDWTDTHLSLAECAQTLGEPENAFQHAKRALEMGKPNSILILNPLQYTAHPRAIMAVCLMQLNRYDEARRCWEDALAICPTYPLITTHLPLWQGHIMREQAVAAWLSCSELLAGGEEFDKARDLMRTVPYYAARDPRVIARKTGLWQQSLKVATPEPLDPKSAAAKFIVRHLEAA